MDIFVLDEEFTRLTILDSYQSFIWTDRYRECGDFEIYISPDSSFIPYLAQGYYLWRRDSQHVMIIERIEISTDAEDGPWVVVSGRSLESILDRRVIWTQTKLEGGLEKAIIKLLNDNITRECPNEKRRIENLYCEESHDPRIEAIQLEAADYFGDNLYELTTTLCQEADLGFKITLSNDGHFVFSLYMGVDRSYEQTERPYIVFSPQFENLISSKYISDTSTFKNIALVGGEEPSDAETTRVTTSTGDISASGMNRREVYLDASSTKSTYTNDDGDTITYSESEYIELLCQAGKEELTEHSTEEVFDGEVDYSVQWKFGEDFHVGDLVQIVNEYGMEARTRITEFITSDSTSGKNHYLSFEVAPATLYYEREEE